MNNNDNNTKTMIASRESRILYSGIVLAVVYTTGLFLLTKSDLELFRNMLVMGFINMIFGRAASLSFGFTLNVSRWAIIVQTMVLETIAVLIIYPLFIFAWHKLLNIDYLDRFFNKIRSAAEEHHDKVKKYGLIGLFAFVVFPFWMTGPVVGSIIGFLLGFDSIITISIVLLGTYFAIFGWAFVFYNLHVLFYRISPYLPYLFLTAIILVVIAGYILGKIKRKHSV